MRRIERTNKFKREKRADSMLDDALSPAVELLATDGELPQRLRDHALGGSLKGYRDCHVKPDLVLIYSKSDEALTLVRLGSHAELFG